ncbi:MAG: AAA family ATPase [Gammaproteobacteria bacterium]|nr:AAA family ATPase [Gammaproteobacteria bacterium]
MYLDYFGLKDYPFRITPDTDYLYMSAAHSRAKAYMEYAIFNREGFVVITGEIGSGKTTLIKKLLSELDDNIIVAKIFQTQLDEVELLQAILVEFGLNPFAAKKVELLNMLNQFMVENYLDGKQVLLIIDDAQNLSKRVLEEITMMSAVETQKEKILHVILVGQPELNHKLEAPDMEQLLQRVSLRYHVRALSEDETRAYVIHRLKVAGLSRHVFDKQIFNQIYEYTGGIPRLINTLCDTALTCCYADNEKMVNRDEFDNAIKELNWTKYSKRIKRNHIISDDNLYKDSMLSTDSLSSVDARDLSHGSFGPIASRALVEISRQLTRIADHLDAQEKPAIKKS